MISVETDLFRCTPVNRFSLGPLKALVYSPLTGGSAVMSDLDADLLMSCQRFDSLSNHAERSDSYGGSMFVEDSTSLADMAKAHLLVSYKDLGQRATAGEPAGPPSGIDWLVVQNAGCSIADSVAALKSCAESKQTWQGRHSLLLVDSSADSSRRDMYRSACRDGVPGGPCCLLAATRFSGSGMPFAKTAKSRLKS